MKSRLHKFREFSLRWIMISLGVFIGALSVLVFMAPFDIAPGGVTGVAVILAHLVDTPIGLVVLLLNIPIQYLGYRLLPGGWRVVAWTLYVVVTFSTLLDLMGPYLPPEGLTDNVLLNALFGGITGGIAGGLIYRSGGTFGGTSTLALILQRRTGTPMSTTFLYTDMLIIGMAGLVFGWEAALYAVVALFISGLATDYVMEGPSIIRTAVIITDHPQEVAEAVLSTLHRGVTGWEARGMYTGQQRWMLYVTVSRSQMRELRQLVMQTDPTAFMVIGQGHAAYGEGFRGSRKRWKTPEPE